MDHKRQEFVKIDKKEFEIPSTTYVRDIEDKVFQGIVLHCLSHIEGISLVEGGFIDNILGRSSLEGIKGIYTQQDSKHQTITIKVEVNICYGESIPKKAALIQTRITEDITKLTGLHVSSVHVIFKNVISPNQVKKLSEILEEKMHAPLTSAEPDHESKEE